MTELETNDPDDTAPAPARSGSERLAAWLVGLATLLAVVSVFSTWVRVQALDTDTWVELSDELLDEPEVREALSVYLVDQLYVRLDLATEIEDGLPDDLKGVAGPLTAALRGPATDGVNRLISSDRFRSTWTSVNRTTHETLVRILRDETRQGVSTADGIVTIELRELIRVVGEQLGLSASFLDRLPEDAGQITVFESEELDNAQAAVRVLDFMSWFLFVLVVALYAIAVYVAGDGRLRVLRNIGLGLIGAGIFVLVVRSVAISNVVNATVDDPGQRPLASVTGLVSTGLLRQMAWSGVIYGLLIAGFASLLGARSWARSTRRFVSPLLNASAGAVAGATALIIMVVLWWSPGRAFDRWVTGLTLIALIIGAVVALRRTTQHEFGDVTFEDVSASIRRGRGGSASPTETAVE